MVARPGALQATFNSGEVAPELLGRPDLRAWANGAQVALIGEAVSWPLALFALALI